LPAIVPGALEDERLGVRGDVRHEIADPLSTRQARRTGGEDAGPGNRLADGLQLLGGEPRGAGHGGVLDRAREEREVALRLHVRRRAVEEEGARGGVAGEEGLEKRVGGLAQAVNEEVPVDEVEGLPVRGEQLVPARLVWVDPVRLGPELAEAPG